MCYVTRALQLTRGSETRVEQTFFFECAGSEFSFIAVTECFVVSFCRRLICGPNAIDVEITPIWKLLIKEVISPVFCLDIG